VGVGRCMIALVYLRGYVEARTKPPWACLPLIDIWAPTGITRCVVILVPCASVVTLPEAAGTRRQVIRPRSGRAHLIVRRHLEANSSSGREDTCLIQRLLEFRLISLQQLQCFWPLYGDLDMSIACGGLIDAYLHLTKFDRLQSNCYIRCGVHRF